MSGKLVAEREFSTNFIENCKMHYHLGKKRNSR